MRMSLSGQETRKVGRVKSVCEEMASMRACIMGERKETRTVVVSMLGVECSYCWARVDIGGIARCRSESSKSKEGTEGRIMPRHSSSRKLGLHDLVVQMSMAMGVAPRQQRSVGKHGMVD